MESGNRTDTQELEPLRQEDKTDRVRPWDEIEPGRFMPRRVRGSFRGGKLG